MKEIVMTAKETAELKERPTPEPRENEVLTRTHYTVISAGTERANLLDLPNTFAYGKWPKREGYSGIGTVEKVGENVKKVKPGDRVLVYHGTHADHSCVKEENVYPVPAGLSVRDEEAVICIIGAMGLGGLTKTALEIGESALVVGTGMLGLFATACARACGALPVIASDLSSKRRELALRMGADYALDPGEEKYVQRVKELTGGKGVDVVVEVTGNPAALSRALDCCARGARVALNGCTRTPGKENIDFYRQVHVPGITLIGAHNKFRPIVDSRPHCRTNEYDVLTLVRMIASCRLDVSPLISEIHAPGDCTEVFRRLANDPDFPVGVLFDWSKA